MANYNIDIQLDKLPGARVMDIKGSTQTRQCIVIPIDNERGTVIDSYSKFDSRAGAETWKPLQGVHLNIVAYEMRQEKFGQTHMVKANVSKETFMRRTEEQQKSMPIIGHLKPWGAQVRQAQAPQQSPEPDNDDLPW